VGKVQVQCCDRFRQMMGLGRSDDGCGDNGKPGITEDEYEAVARRFASVGIKPSRAKNVDTGPG